MSGHIKGSAVDDLTQEEILDKRINTIQSKISEIMEHTKFVVIDDNNSQYSAEKIV